MCCDFILVFLSGGKSKMVCSCRALSCANHWERRLRDPVFNSGIRNRREAKVKLHVKTPTTAIATTIGCFCLADKY